MPLVLSLDKSLDILEAVAEHQHGIGTRALAKQLRINLTTVHNIAGTLRRRGYFRQDPLSKKFMLGPRLMLLARHTDLLRAMTDAALPYVQQTAATLGESVMLTALVDGRIIRLAYMTSPKALCVHEPDDMGPNAYCTACGKLMLSSMSAQALDAYFQETPLIRYTKQTETSQKRIRADLDQIRRQGYATSIDQLCEGVSAMAVPLSDSWENVIAALGVGVPTVRFKKKQQDFALATLKKNAAAIMRAWWSHGTHQQSKKEQSR